MVVGNLKNLVYWGRLATQTNLKKYHTECKNASQSTICDPQLNKMISDCKFYILKKRLIMSNFSCIDKPLWNECLVLLNKIYYKCIIYLFSAYFLFATPSICVNGVFSLITLFPCLWQSIQIFWSLNTQYFDVWRAQGETVLFLANIYICTIYQYVIGHFRIRTFCWISTKISKELSWNFRSVKTILFFILFGCCKNIQGTSNKLKSRAPCLWAPCKFCSFKCIVTVAYNYDVSFKHSCSVVWF